MAVLQLKIQHSGYGLSIIELWHWHIEQTSENGKKKQKKATIIELTNHNQQKKKRSELLVLRFCNGHEACYRNNGVIDSILHMYLVEEIFDRSGILISESSLG